MNRHILEQELHLIQIQPRTPDWARAEQLELSIPQKTIWRYSDRVIASEKRSARLRLPRLTIRPKLRWVLRPILTALFHQA